MSKRKSIVTFAVIIAVTAGLVLTSLYGIEINRTTIVPKVTDTEEGIRRGLDLVGGSSITYEAVIPEGTPAAEIESGMSSSVALMQARLTMLGFTEATVSRTGTNRILVEIPSVTKPEEAVQKLGATAQLEFVDSDGEVVLTGTDIVKAEANYGQLNETSPAEYFITLNFTSDAVAKFAAATKKVSSSEYKAESKNYISIQLDGESISNPYVQNEINDSSAVISGSFTSDYATYIAGVINGGRLPFTLKDIQLSAIGPTLGEKALETSIFAGFIGIALVMLFMLIFYRLPGAVACVALVFYSALLLIIFSVFKLNLSLPGIAGIILSIGMAVDANIIIFERIKEELHLGKTVGAATKNGFHRAFTAILDSNITTLIAAVVLWIFGTGPIVGFAQTLFIGVLCSMLTAIVISRMLLNSLIGMNIRNIKAYGA